MNNATYQALPGISSHGLIAMLDSPAACYRKYLDPQRPTQEETDLMRFGTLIHCLALTPRWLGNEFLVSDYNRRSRAGKDHYAELKQSGLTVIKPETLEKARAVVAALHYNPDARKLLFGGKKERSLIQPRSSGLLPLKSRLDIHHESKRQVVELKTTWSLAKVEPTMDRYHYPLSAAFYRAISRSQSVMFIFVETCEPFKVAVFEISRAQLQDGREQFETALQRFDECWRANHWPEAEPVAALDDDPLMMPMPWMTANSKSNPNRQRFEMPVGELAL